MRGTTVISSGHEVSQSVSRGREIGVRDITQIVTMYRNHSSFITIIKRLS